MRSFEVGCNYITNLCLGRLRSRTLLLLPLLLALLVLLCARRHARQRCLYFRSRTTHTRHHARRQLARIHILLSRTAKPAHIFRRCEPWSHPSFFSNPAQNNNNNKKLSASRFQPSSSIPTYVPSGRLLSGITRSSESNRVTMPDVLGLEPWRTSSPGIMLERPAIFR